ncbi:MAG: tRNA (adenosine(37)-N6)-threonylcarbamoyltransferase complex dimerization subunit type 1 TsaB [Alphaproteobacteria bacterium]|nr:tRNA (adenosine(37)-N6)-threonylcarbamoyltransferase complex dimerization subunit type 1 TsaB [Alphaproteobacteria bacterium]
MKLLAMDTATAACSAAVWCDGDVVARRFEPMVRGHAERLMPMVRAVMDEAAAGDFSALDAIAVTVGPGAFTGVRIGLAAARALGLAAARPVAGFTTLETVAAAQEEPGKPLLVALDSKREDLYVQLFDAGLTPLGAPAALLPGDVPAAVPAVPVAVCGDAAARAIAALAAAGREAALLNGPSLPDAAALARLAAARRQDREAPCGVGNSMPQPLYLRPPDVSLPAPRR